MFKKCADARVEKDPSLLSHWYLECRIAKMAVNQQEAEKTERKLRPLYGKSSFETEPLLIFTWELKKQMLLTMDTTRRLFK